MTIRDHIETLLRQGLADAQRDGLLPTTLVEELIIERPQNPEHGDFACSVPLKLARPMRTRPMAIAEVLVSQVPPDGAVRGSGPRLPASSTSRWTGHGWRVRWTPYAGPAQTTATRTSVRASGFRSSSSA